MSKFTLYELVAEEGNPDGRSFSPHVWKTKVDFAILGIDDVQSIGKTFLQIRGELSETSKNPAVTVPTIEVDGQWTTDSWKIAEFLEQEHGRSGKSLFGGSAAGRDYAKFIELWTQVTLGPELRPFAVTAVYDKLEPACKEYFVKSKFGGKQEALDAIRKRWETESEVKSQQAAARGKLAVVEQLLKLKKERGQPLWLAGEGPSHADACLFGWFAFSSLQPGVEEGIWRHEENPTVGEWLDLVFSSGLVDRKDLDKE
ncbi:hypothetical protein IAU60_003757 [Kwoniella sp. DSM 27419]